MTSGALRAVRRRARARPPRRRGKRGQAVGERVDVARWVEALLRHGFDQAARARRDGRQAAAIDSSAASGRISA